MPNRTRMPAISREVEFIARNVSEADAIYNGDMHLDELVKELTETVYDRADDAVESLLLGLEEEVKCSVKGVVRIEWVNTDRKLNWSSKGRIYNALGRKKRIGWLGVELPRYNTTPLRLIGWVYVLGGQEGRRQLAHVCGRKIFARVASDHPKEYSEAYSELNSWAHEQCDPKLRRLTMRITEVGPPVTNIQQPTEEKDE